MKISIPVKDKSEGDAIRAALVDPTTRAFVIVSGVLLQLPTDRARQRVINWATEWASDPAYADPGDGTAPLRLHFDDPTRNGDHSTGE